MGNVTALPKTHRLYTPWDSVQKHLAVRAIEVTGTNQVMIHRSHIAELVENTPTALNQAGFYRTAEEAIAAKENQHAHRQ